MIYFKQNADLLKNRFIHKFNRRCTSERSIVRRQHNGCWTPAQVRTARFWWDLGRFKRRFLPTGRIHAFSCCLPKRIYSKKSTDISNVKIRDIFRYFISTDIFDAEYNHYAAPIFLIIYIFVQMAFWIRTINSISLGFVSDGILGLNGLIRTVARSGLCYSDINRGMWQKPLPRSLYHDRKYFGENILAPEISDLW